MFDNLRLSIAYTLAHIWPEVYPIILTFLFGLPVGLGSLQVQKHYIIGSGSCVIIYVIKDPMCKGPVL